jgi:hypothetical protein
MFMSANPKSRPKGIKSHRIDDKSWLFSKVIPGLFILLAIIMLGLILFAAGVLIGLIPWV